MPLFKNKDYKSIANQMMKFHEKLIKKPNNMYEIHFYQRYIAEIKDAEELLKQYKRTQEYEYVKQAWEIFHLLFIKIINHYKIFNIISLEYISPKLYDFQESNIALPGTFSLNNNEIIKGNKNEIKKIYNSNNIIKIKKIGKWLNIFNTKQNPRQMTMLGTNNKEYKLLLKGHEDLRQDERVMQLFDLVNIILANDNETYKKKLFIDRYTVIPLSHNSGLIGWVPNCDSLYSLVKGERTVSNTILNAEFRAINKLYPKYESGHFLSKVEVFKEGISISQGMELKTVIWKQSKNCETWLNRRTNYSRSLAVMSIVGYILGLGDRHPNNLMMSRNTGKIIHIDFGDCFEVAMKRNKFPEKIPFRLTRMLIKALEVSGIEGTFRLVSEKIMELLRNNKDSLIAILSSFVYDPLISFRLMIPMIMKKRNNYIKNTNNKNEIKNINNNYELQNNEINNNIENNNIIIDIQSVKINHRGTLGKLNQVYKQFLEDNNKKNKNENEKEEEKNDENDKIEAIHGEEEKNEKKKMEDDERQIFNVFEEKDEIESEELNKIAQIVLDRIQDKLSGTDFYPNLTLEPKTQVNKLIIQATSYENLSQSYIGWCPFW